ncbi:unnamed protein product [Mytilus edulis]|uniref:Peptidase aspartic putative domain-containing protein n=1 Tax=Mytilus edulis TaxID=6550 RepID=A0A8S3THR8_MYTED|nr:unnamed protein product [Mytilus edulis]
MNINNSTQGISAQSGFSDVSVSSIDSAFQRLASTLHEGFNLPKPELLTFNGTPLDYSKFIRNFETNIEGRISDNSLRLSYLIQYCRGEAKCCIEDCVLLDSDEGYKRARAILYSRYGKHFASNCRKPKACTVSDCNVKHNILLHSWSKPGFDHAATQPSVNCAATKGSMIKNCLGIIPVLVKGRNGNSCKTFALLDDGADKTLCDERLLQKLNIASKPVTFEMSTVSSSGVWSVKKLPISARSAAENVDIRKLPYLADIQIPSTDLTEVMLLIGTDSPNAHIPLERQLERMWTSDFDDRAREDKNGLSIEDKEAMKMMGSSITQEDGHFKLGLPWRDRETTLQITWFLHMPAYNN